MRLNGMHFPSKQIIGHRSGSSNRFGVSTHPRTASFFAVSHLVRLKVRILAHGLNCRVALYLQSSLKHNAISESSTACTNLSSKLILLKLFNKLICSAFLSGTNLYSKLIPSAEANLLSSALLIEPRFSDCSASEFKDRFQIKKMWGRMKRPLR